MFSEDGLIVKCRSVSLMLDSESWDAELINKVNIARWKAQFVTAQTPMEDVDEKVVEPLARPVIPKDFSITRDLLEKTWSF